MRVTQKEMESSHGRIVEGASRLLRERGVRSTSVADAMKEAGMTHGGFYRHFATKDDLVVEALRSAFDDFARPLELRQQVEPPKSVAAEYKALYLSSGHVDNPGQGCPMPAIGSDLARESQTVKDEFAAGLRRVATALSAACDGSTEERQADALREIAMLVGAVQLARACGGNMADEILNACRK
jgi:TetR/AcrR family transcriptional repressor of nem operon